VFFICNPRCLGNYCIECVEGGCGTRVYDFGDDWSGPRSKVVIGWSVWVA
jgi:hypothetical protein